MKFTVNGLRGLVCCPSYKRAGRVETLSYLPDIRVYTAESEAGNYYRAQEGDFMGMPDTVQGNISRVRNWILNNAGVDVICIVDDDLQYLGYWEGDDEKRLTKETLVPFLQKYTALALELGTPLWGVNLNIDKQCYREYTPFSFTSVVLAPFMVHIKPVCRFDEQIPLKEDYDFCLQTLNSHRKILRVNKFHYLCRQGVAKTGIGQTGGCASMRSVQEELRQLKLLQKKWGESIVQVDDLEKSRSHSSNKEKRWDVNPVIRIPIQGV